MGKQSNAERIRSATIGLAAAGAVGTVALGGLAWAQDNADETATNTSTTTTDVVRSDSSDSGSTSPGSWPRVTAGSNGSSSHTRSTGS